MGADARLTFGKCKNGLGERPKGVQDDRLLPSLRLKVFKCFTYRLMLQEHWCSALSLCQRLAEYVLFDLLVAASQLSPSCRFLTWKKSIFAVLVETRLWHISQKCYSSASLLKFNLNASYVIGCFGYN